MPLNRSIQAFVLVAGGVALGWVASLVFEASRQDDVAEYGGDLDPGVRRRSAKNPGASLKGGKGTAPLIKRLEAALEGKDAAAVAEAAKGITGPPTRTALGWSALLTLYALADQSEDFLRSAPDAIHSGLAPGAVLDLVRLFPLGHQSDVLERLLGAVPDATWPDGVIADIFIEAGDPQRALNVLSTALAAAPHHSLIARMVKIDPQKAKELLLQLAADHGWDTDRIEQIGAEFVKGGNPELSVPFFQAALAKSPLDRSVLERLGAVAPELALAHARKLVQDYAGNPTAWISLGKMELAAGNPRGSFDAYRQAASRALTKDSLYGLLKADPQRAYAAAMEFATAQTDDETLGVIACLALASDHPTESLDALAKAHERDPTDYKWNAALVDLDPRRAAEILGASAQSYRGRRRDEVLGAWADALAESGSKQAAFDQYRNAFDLDPDDGSWQAGLARTDPAKAIPLLEERRRAAGDNPELLGALADAYAGSGRRDEARALYEEAAKGDRGIRWYGRMALVDPSGAKARLDEAISKDPKSDEAWGALGDYHRVLGDASAAREAYAKARDLDPSNLTWQARLGSSASRAH